MTGERPKTLRAQSRAGALAQRVPRFLHHILRAGDRVGVAVSGGADSLALLLLLLELREKLGIVLSVVHFNHKLRGKSSDADEKFVAQLAAKHGLTFHVGHADVAAKAKRERANLEDTARRARYAFFARLIKEDRLTHIAVAHTADDQAETVLAHILRGTGLAGLGAIHPVAGHIVRPLLDVRRVELRAYLRSRKQAWREDATNLDTTKMRARIRKKLLPLLERHFQPAVVEHLATLAELAREDEAFLDAIAQERLATLAEKHAGRIQIKTSDLLQPYREMNPASSKALSARLVRQIVEDVKPRGGQLTSQHVDAILALASHGQSGKSLPLPGSVEVRRDRDAILFLARASVASGVRESKAAPRNFAYDVDLARAETTVRVPQLECVFRLTVIDWPVKRGETSQRGAVLDRHRLHSPLVLRNWLPGDTLHALGRQHTHKLKRLLNERRISRWERDGWPVLTSGGIVVWARGFPVAAEFAADERTRAGIVIAEEQL
ncbi:MAG TPA: tRNA lysidine(34) synthetase TilS [Candidatus Acidoferrum sp.]|nr:tRNA lysidine(34) synthetase TilS [Candidatus Acidoferrum sp.]